MKSWSAITASRNDLEIRKAMKGVRLVGELNLELSGDIFRLAESSVGPLLQRHEFSELKKYPHSLCVYLVAQGRHKYRQGAFWTELELDDSLSPAQQGTIGNRFLEALRNLALETFDREQGLLDAQKFLFPILLHGGIPEYGADEVWRALISDLRRGIFDVAEIRSRLGINGITNLAVTKPARRFITFGEDYALDLLARMIDLLDSLSGQSVSGLDDETKEKLSGESGIPLYLIRSLSPIGEIKTSSSKRMGRPQVSIDPYDGEGPTLALPMLPKEFPSVVFRIHDGTSRYLRASTSESVESPLAMSPDWKVTCEFSGFSRSWEFSGIPRGRSFLFDAQTGSLLPNQSVVRGSQVLILAERGVVPVARGKGHAPQLIEECADLSGSWRKWNLRRYDLENVDDFTVPFVGQKPEDAAIIFVGQSGQLVHEKSSPIMGVFGEDGQLVYGDLPEIEVGAQFGGVDGLRLRWNDRGNGWVDHVGPVADSGGLLQLSQILGDDGIFDGELLVRGPLGSDFRRRFAVIPGLSTTIQSSPISPSIEFEVTLSERSSEEPPRILKFPPYQSRQTVHLRKEFLATVVIPRITASVRIDGANVAIQSEPVTVDIDQIVSGQVETLALRTGVEVPTFLELRVGTKLVKRTSLVTTSRDGGRWSFSLSHLIDDLSQSNASEITIYIHPADVVFPCIRVISKYEVTGLACRENKFEIDSGLNFLEFTWSENKSFSNRVFRLWSLARPWERPVEIHIPENASPQLAFQVGDEIPLGRCLAEVALADEWRRIERPLLGAPNVCQLVVGSPAQIAQRLEHLNPTDVSNAIELTLQNRSDALAELAVSEFVDSAGQLAAALELSISDQTWHVPTSLGQFIRLIKAAGRRSSLFADVLAEFQMASPRRMGEFVVNALPYLRKVNTDDYSLEVRERIWSISEEIGACLDAVGAGRDADPTLWARYTGWPQLQEGLLAEGESTEDVWLPQFPGEISRDLSQRSVETLRGIIPYLGAISVTDQKPLGWGGYFDAVLELFELAEAEPRWITRINEDSLRFGRYLERKTDGTLFVYRQLTPEPGSRPLAYLPQALLAVAIHAVRSRKQASLAVELLLEANTKVPLLVKRSVLFAAALTLMEGSESDE